MFKKQNLGILLVGFGVLSGLLTLAIHYFSRGQAAVYGFILLCAMACIVIGTILAFTQLLDRQVQPVIEEINADIEDDIEDLRKGRATKVQAMVVISALLALVFLVYVLKLHKFEATWGGLPVALVTILAVGAVLFFATQNRWFRNQQLSTPMKIYLVPAAGLALSLILGLNLAEDARALNWAGGGEVVYNDYAPMGIDFFGDTASSGIFDFLLPDCSDDACVALFLVIALVALTFILVVASAIVPHFWFLSGWVLVAILGLITVHEIRLRRAGKDIGDRAGTG